MSGLFGGGNAVDSSSPVVSSLRVQTSTRGKPITLAYGKPRISGNLIWYGEFTPVAHTSTQSSGGKGGGGGVSSTSYTYTSAVVIGLCEGAINSIPRIWRDKEVFSGITVPVQTLTVQSEFYYPGSSAVVTVANAALFTADLGVAFMDPNGANGAWMLSPVQLTPGVDYTVDHGTYTFASKYAGCTVGISYQYTVPGYTLDACAQINLALVPGDASQTALGWLQTKHPSEALAYRGVAYVGASVYDLGESPELGNHNFEIDTRFGYSASIRDAHPKDVIIDLLTNSRYGAGFPISKVGDYSQFSSYCVANNIFVSPAYTEQTEVRQMLDTLLKISNSDVVLSDTGLKFVPYGDVQASANGVTYTPDLTPIYDLTDDDFIAASDEDPIKVTRSSNADAFNHVRVKFYNRDIGYSEDIAEAKDQDNIDLYGLRSMDVVEMKEICDPAAARMAAQILLQRSLYVRNTYDFVIGERYCLLEGMDLVTLTDASLGLNRALVRIKTIEENEDGDLAVTAEEVPQNIGNAPRYPAQASAGYSVNFNAAAGNVSEPVIFEPPDQLAGELEVWMAIAGTANFGGCYVWLSYDGATFKQVGKVEGSARLGTLSASIALGSAQDAINTLAVDLQASNGELISGTADDARGLRTLCIVGDELLAYQTATLTAKNQYALTGLVRGAYGTPIASHDAGTKFARLDQAIFKLPFQVGDIGKTLSVKLQAFNPFGSGVQALADISPYTYIIRGSALNSPLPNVANLTNNFVAGITNLHWDAISDFRSPIDYEVRLGTDWATGRTLGRTPLTSFPAVGDGTYWVAAHYRSPRGVDAYSLAPQSLVIAGAVLVRNVVATVDEAATGWSGTCGGGAILHEGTIELAGSGNLLASTDFLNEPDVLWMGGVAPSGTYQVPVGHQVNIGRVAPCNVIVAATGYAQSIYDDFLSLANVLDVSDLFNAALGPKIALQPQIRTAQADGVFGEWQNFVPGAYNAQFFDSRVLMTSSDTQVTAVLSGFIFTVDVPDRTDKGTNSECPAAGLAVAFDSPFNAVPNVQVTILDARQGDDLILDTPTMDGFSMQVMNAGVGVTRNINWTAQGY